MAPTNHYTPAMDPGLQHREREILDLARERWDSVATSTQETKYRDEAIKALEFRDGEQWDPKEAQRRASAGRPCLTINMTGQYERQILNEPRRNRPGIVIRPVGNGADVETARVLQGLVRHVEQQSHADQAYDGAYEDGVRCGRGYFRLLLEYEDAHSFQQRVRIAPIFNPFSVYYGPAKLPTYADADWCFIFEQVPKKAFQDQYDISTTELGGWQMAGDTWVSKDEVRVAEYFFRERQWHTLAMFGDGTTTLLEPLLYEGTEMLDERGAFEELVVAMLRPQHGELLVPWLRRQSQRLETLLEAFPVDFRGWWVPHATQLLSAIQMARQTAIEHVWHTKITGQRLLESAVWPGKHLPILPVFGNILRIDNEARYSGYLKDAMDPMRAKNYWVTMQAEHISQSAPAPWLVAEEQIDAYQREWETANRIPRAYLKYRRYDDAQRDLGVPQRNNVEPPIQAITLAMEGSERDIENTLFSRSTLGLPGKEQSGKALEKREEQVDTGTFHYQDNLRRALEFCGEQLVDLLPKLLSTETVQRIIGDDGSTSMVLLRPGGKQEDEQLPPGIQGIYDVSNGTYDVTVDVGPSYESKRQEALDTLVQLGRDNPKLADLSGDLVVKNIDAEGMDELSRRYKKTLPPNVLEDGPQNDPDQQIALLQSQQAQLQQQLEALNALQQQILADMQTMQQENALLKSGQAIKQQELVLQSRELDLKKREIEAEILLEQEKLDIERLKIQQMHTNGKETAAART